MSIELFFVEVFFGFCVELYYICYSKPLELDSVRI